MIHYFNILYIFLILGCRVVVGQSAWIEQDANTDAYLSDVFFVNDSVGWIVGLCPVLKTTDGGATWVESDTSLGENFSSIFFIDDSTGWIAGGNGKIIHTKDGGGRWTEQYKNSLYPLTSIFFVTKNIGFACGTSRLVIKTTDGGNSWEVLDTDPHQPGAYHTIFFIDSLTGWVAGEHSHIYKTTDGGQNWVLDNLNRKLDEDINSIKFLDDTTGFAVGGWYPMSGIILKTLNGGDTWTLMDSLRYELYSCSFGSDSVGWAVGRFGSMRRTTDSGETWEEYDAGYELPILQSVFFLNKDVGWIVGSDGVILKTTTGSVTSIESAELTNYLPRSDLLVKNFPNPFNSSTKIELAVQINCRASIKIFDLRGRLVATVYSGRLKEGTHIFNWNGSNTSSGMYFLKTEISENNYSASVSKSMKKMILIK